MNSGYSKFYNNTSKLGGAIYIDNKGQYINSSNSIFQNNRASEKGGAIYMSSDGTYEESTKILFDNNSAT